MQKITPFLWFDNQAEEAATFYTSTFKNSRIVSVDRYPEGSPLPAGTAMLVNFEIDGQPLMALNGGPAFTLNEAFSLYISCESQAEVDELWEKLTDGGEESQCGWVKDKYGLSWQVVPKLLGELMADPDPAKASRVMQAMLGMQKIDSRQLQDAYDGRS